MKKIRLIASDMDGTLVNDKGIISEENITAIRKAQEMGIKVAIATGRPYDGTKREMEEAGLVLPLICLNGAEIFTEKGENLKTTPLSKEVAREIFKVCKQKGVYCDVFTNQGILSDSEEEHLEMFYDILKISDPSPDLTKEKALEKVKDRIEKENVRFVSEYDKEINDDSLQINKLVLFSNDATLLRSAREALDELDLVLKISSSSPNNIEINHPDVHKGAAVEYLAETLGIQMDEVMTIGDNLNDMTMLRMAGRGVAMENAAEEIKRVVKYHTKANYENGVAYAIEDMIKDCY